MKVLIARSGKLRAAEKSAARRLACCVLAAVLLAGQLPDVASAGQVANWSTSNLDSWFYPAAESPGTRLFGPTFAGELEVNAETGEFVPLDEFSPARLGSTLVAFNTTAGSVPIPKDLLPGRYHVTSVRMTMTMGNGSGQTLFYEPDPVSAEDIRAELSQSPPPLNRQRPMELYGARFRSGFTGLEFTPSSPTLFDEATHPYSAGGYRGYPVIGDATSPFDYVDVSNSVTGGFSATEKDAFTESFTPQPWAIGTTGLAKGAALGTNVPFAFELNLELPGVRQYVRDSLSDGGLGFFVSSLHLTDQQGFAGGYPQWYLRELGALRPTLRVEFEILPQVLAGDYDGDGTVAAADYEIWKLAFGKEVAAFYGADGNGDGLINAADYTVWRNNVGASLAAGAGVVGGNVPEPGAVVVLLWGGSLVGLRRKRRRGDRETKETRRRDVATIRDCAATELRVYTCRIIGRDRGDWHLDRAAVSGDSGGEGDGEAGELWE